MSLWIKASAKMCKCMHTQT